MATLGTCSICGGRVSIPDVWHSVIPPVPTCEKCGATMKNPYGKVIKMDPPKKIIGIEKIIERDKNEKKLGGFRHAW